MLSVARLSLVELRSVPTILAGSFVPTRCSAHSTAQQISMGHTAQQKSIPWRTFYIRSAVDVHAFDSRVCGNFGYLYRYIHPFAKKCSIHIVLIMEVAPVFVVAAHVLRLFELGTKLCKLIHETSCATGGPPRNVLSVDNHLFLGLRTLKRLSRKFCDKLENATVKRCTCHTKIFV
jgi:hypothetical protein